MPEAVILAAIRTPVGRYASALAAERPDDLAGRLASDRPGIRLLALDQLAGLDDPTEQEAGYAHLLDDPDDSRPRWPARLLRS